MKIPLALANAADASLPTFVELGKLCLRILLTHANGGSNSTADGGPPAPLVPPPFVVGGVVVAAVSAVVLGFVVVPSPPSVPPSAVETADAAAPVSAGGDVVDATSAVDVIFSLFYDTGIN